MNLLNIQNLTGGYGTDVEQMPRDYLDDQGYMPRTTMLLERYEGALAKTQELWKRVEWVEPIK